MVVIAGRVEDQRADAAGIGRGARSGRALEAGIADVDQVGAIVGRPGNGFGQIRGRRGAAGDVGDFDGQNFRVPANAGHADIVVADGRHAPGDESAVLVVRKVGVGRFGVGVVEHDVAAGKLHVGGQIRVCGEHAGVADRHHDRAVAGLEIPGRRGLDFGVLPLICPVEWIVRDRVDRQLVIVRLGEQHGAGGDQLDDEILLGDPAQIERGVFDVDRPQVVVVPSLIEREQERRFGHLGRRSLRVDAVEHAAGASRP